MRYFLEACIQSVLQALEGLEAELIVVDNNSPDDSCAMVKQKFPEVQLIENTENVGFAKANNQGVAAAKASHICILNPDTIVPATIFTSMLQAIDTLEYVGFMGCKLIDGTGAFLPESKRNIPSPLTSLRRLFGIRIGNVRSYYADHIPPTAVGQVAVLVGAFMFGKKETYTCVGGFDEDYFMYGEDIDLSYKVRKRGFLNYYIGTTAVLHFKGESTDRNAVYIQRFYGAMRLFYQKHFRSNWLLDRMVSTAIHMIAFSQRWKKPTTVVREIAQYYLVSDNPLLQAQLAKVLRKKVQLISVAAIEDLAYTNIELIFDNEYVSYTHIIALMQRYKGDTITYRIRPAGCTYTIGSDRSDSKGVVTQFGEIK